MGRLAIAVVAEQDPAAVTPLIWQRRTTQRREALLLQMKSRCGCRAEWTTSDRLKPFRTKCHLSIRITSSMANLPRILSVQATVRESACFRAARSA